MEQLKSITNRRTVYKKLKTLKIEGKCIKECQIIAVSLNYYFISIGIRVNKGKLNIGNVDINHPIIITYIKLLKTFS